MNKDKLKSQWTMIEPLIKNFESEQTLLNLQSLKNNGVELYRLQSNRWQRLNEYDLPLNRFVPLYNDNFEIYGIGIY